MLYLTMRKATLPDDSEAVFDDLVSRYSKFLNPVIGPSLAIQAKALGLASAQIVGRRHESMNFDDEVERGEIFAGDGEIYVLRLLAEIEMSEDGPQSSGFYYSIAAISASRELVHLKEIESIFAEVAKISLQEHEYTSQDFARIKREAKEATVAPTEIEVSAAKILADKNARSLALGIKQSFGLLVGDVPKQFSKIDKKLLSQAQAILEGAGIIASEVMLICSRSGNQVMRVSSSETVTQTAALGAKCACGRDLSQERQEQALTITELGRSLLDKSRWMSLVVMDALVSLGVARDCIIVESTIGGDELDCIADINGELALFELKDKEFNLREAYSFGAKIGIVGPQHSMIITTEYVGGDAKNHFERSEKARRASRPRRVWETSAAKVRYIEGLDSLSDGLAALVGSINRGDSRRILESVLPQSSLSSTPILDLLQGK